VQAVVVYESMFGNTRTVARAVAEGLSSRMQVETVEVGEAPGTVGDAVDLLVVGAPTHAFSLSRPSTRRSAAEQAPEGPVSKGIGVREWLDSATAAPGLRAAAFATRVKKPVPGSAAKAASRRLRRAGCRLASEPRDFFVEDTLGPLIAGEVERARAWGERLATIVAPSGETG
jgi:hypothetical protein